MASVTVDADHCIRAYSPQKYKTPAWNFMKKEIPAHAFSCK